jgi:large subunit ribosomal protein L29
MDIVDIRAKSLQELCEICLNLKKELVHLSFQRKLGQYCNVSRFKLIRKSIAQVLTVLNEKKRGKKNA